jgi:hypothetical protein
MSSFPRPSASAAKYGEVLYYSPAAALSEVVAIGQIIMHRFQHEWWGLLHPRCEGRCEYASFGGCTKCHNPAPLELIADCVLFEAKKCHFWADIDR